MQVDLSCDVFVSYFHEDSSESKELAATYWIAVGTVGGIV